MALQIRSFGTAVPEYSASQEDATQVAKVLCGSNSEQRSFVENLYRQTQIKNRHMVLGEAVVRDILEGNADSKSCFVPHGKSAQYAPSTQQRMECYREFALPLAREACASDREGEAATQRVHPPCCRIVHRVRCTWCGSRPNLIPRIAEHHATSSGGIYGLSRGD